MTPNGLMKVPGRLNLSLPEGFDLLVHLSTAFFIVALVELESLIDIEFRQRHPSGQQQLVCFPFYVFRDSAAILLVRLAVLVPSLTLKQNIIDLAYSPQRTNAS